MVSISIDQTEKVATLIERLKKTVGIPLIDKKNEYGEDMTSVLIYLSKEAAK